MEKEKTYCGDCRHMDRDEYGFYCDCEESPDHGIPVNHHSDGCDFFKRKDNK